MFERFTDGARQVVVLAREEARMLIRNYIGTEYFLLGLIRDGVGWTRDPLMQPDARQTKLISHTCWDLRKLQERADSH